MGGLAAPLQIKITTSLLGYVVQYLSVPLSCFGRMEYPGVHLSTAPGLRKPAIMRGPSSMLSSPSSRSSSKRPTP
jgi:hypothetical protein